MGSTGGQTESSLKIMRDELTEENLKKYGFSDEHVKSLLDSEHCTVRIQNNTGFYFASNESREIISGTEAKYFSIEGEFPFPYDDIDLIEPYYIRKQKTFLERRKEDTRSHYNEALEASRFKELEIKEAEELIEELKVKPKAMKFPTIHIDRLMTYLDWLRSSSKGNNDGQNQSFTFENYFLDNGMIYKSYEYFNGSLFKEMPQSNYYSCFVLNKELSSHPKFIVGKQIDFIYFLSKLPGIKIVDDVALRHFGIKNYRQQLHNMTNRSTVFINHVASILSIRQF